MKTDKLDEITNNSEEINLDEISAEELEQTSGAGPKGECGNYTVECNVFDV